jgi:acetyltransferase
LLAITTQSDSETTCGANPRPQSAISVMRNGIAIEIRSIQPDDEERMVRFHEGLSERTVYMRYFESLSLAARTSHGRLARICFADPIGETVLVALFDDRKSDRPRIVGVGRVNKLATTNKAEVALLVSDEFQGCGVGTELLRQLIRTARGHKIKQLQAEMLRDNTAMQKVLKKCHFHLRLVDPRTVLALCNL